MFGDRYTTRKINGLAAFHRLGGRLVAHPRYRALGLIGRIDKRYVHVQNPQDRIPLGRIVGKLEIGVAERHLFFCLKQPPREFGLPDDAPQGAARS